jgi:putative ABC transport system permease protein
MIHNYFKTAFRHLQKNKLYATINILGLAIGITSCLLIGIYIWHELSYDRFHKNKDRIVRVTWEYNFGDAETKTATTGSKVGPQFQRTFPEVEDFVRIMKYPRVISTGDKIFEEKNFLYADSSFFSIFSFPLIKGNAATALDAPEKMVLTVSTAKKYFGKEDPIGKILKVGNNRDFIITGITEDAPQNSQITFDFIASFKSLNASKTEKWNEANYITYLKLKNNHSLTHLLEKISAYAATVAKEEMGVQDNQYMTYRIEPLTSVHLHSPLDGVEPNNNIVYIYILGAVAFLILLIACVNYTNLSTAQSSGRGAEIAMRKVMGAQRIQVFNQFIIESFLVTIIAIILSIGFSVLLLPFFNQLTGIQLDAGILSNPVTILSLILLSIIISFTAGYYPAFILSGTKVIHILKSSFHFTGSGALRKSLIVFQFIVSIFLIISTIIILQQLSYISNKELGYNKEKVLILPADPKALEQYDDFKASMANQRGVVSVAGAYESLTHIGWSDGLTGGPDQRQITINALPVDEHFIKTLGLKIIAGTDYTRSDVQQFDTSNNGNNIRYTFILNESAVKSLGWTPEEAIGKTVSKGREGIIKAVVKDFHFRSFHEAIQPLVIFLDRRLLGNIFIRISGNTPSVLAALETNWKQRLPHRPFEYRFLDEDYYELYKSEQQTAKVFTTFSTLAILLACLGLFALTAYTMAKRTKEIGIRKVLGASIPAILLLVSKDFLKLVFIAFLIAVPVSWYACNLWLNNFVYKTTMNWWVFTLAGITTLIISFITISLQAINTAIKNPVKNLRNE